MSKRGDDMAYWLFNAITRSRAWQEGRNAPFLVFEHEAIPKRTQKSLGERARQAIVKSRRLV